MSIVDTPVTPPLRSPLQAADDYDIVFESEIDPSAQVSEDGADWYGNLLSVIETGKLKELGAKAISALEADLRTREQWEQVVEYGFQDLGIQFEELNEPFEGACSATHPLILESAVKFQSKASTELLPATGPVRTKIVGKRTPEKEEKADRVKSYMNYVITKRMREYVKSSERMLFFVPLIGVAVKKVWWNEHLSRPVSEHIYIDNFVVSNFVEDLESADRYTEIIHTTKSDLARNFASGKYVRPENFPEPYPIEYGKITRAIQDIIGIAKTNEMQEGYTLCAQYVYLNEPYLPDYDESGVPRPYIVVVEKSTSSVLGVFRNWNKDDPLYLKKEYFADYHFVPGFGWYSFGLFHLLGNFQRSLTAVLRSLVDAGQFANLQGGFKVKGLRVLGDNSPISPGEWKEVESTGVDLQKSLLPLPYKEPSAVLFQLFQNLNQLGQKFADSTEQVVADATNYGPVGTTTALLDASMKFFGAIHKRLHHSQEQELKIVSRLLFENLPERLDYDVYEDSSYILRSDFDPSIIDVCPVSDPNVNSNAYRLQVAQLKISVAQQAPHAVNIKEVYRDFFRALGDENVDRLVPVEPDPTPLSPLEDILQAVSRNKPIRAFSGQDHAAHIAVKQAWMSDPSGGNNEIMASFHPIIAANIREHMLLDYTTKLEAHAQDAAGRNLSLGLAAAELAEMNRLIAENGLEKEPMRMMAEAELLRANVDAGELDHKKNVERNRTALELLKTVVAGQREVNRATEADAKIEMEGFKEGVGVIKDAIRKENRDKKR